MPTHYVIGNWKLNGSLAANEALIAALSALPPQDGVVAGVCVPFPYLSQVAGLVAPTVIRLGAQSLSEYASGAYTGEVSAEMLIELGCAMVIVGHSERRMLFGENDAVVARKAAVALSAGLVPVICVGETLAERESGATGSVIDRQLDALCVTLDQEALGRIVIAYEPVWAIGTGLAATARQVADVHARIRRWVVRCAGEAASVSILYGGSVKPENAAELFALDDVHGGLIGGASLDATAFSSIYRAAMAAQVSKGD